MTGFAAKDEQFRQAAVYNELCTPSTYYGGGGVYEQFADRSRARGWPFTEQQLNELYRVTPHDFRFGINRLLTLDIRLGSLHVSAKEMWLWNRELYPEWKPVKASHLQFDEYHLSSANNRNYAEPRVVWVVVDLTMKAGEAVSYPEGGLAQPGLELLAAHALHFNLSGALRRRQIELRNGGHKYQPAGFWLPGLKARFDGDETFSKSPYLLWQDGQLRLSANEVGMAFPGLTVPQRSLTLLNDWYRSS